ncbi:MAG TPA: hypothetical protein PLS00_05215 [Niabella sp.]|nr:hypothetical protein [Niabella sp.]
MPNSTPNVQVSDPSSLHSSGQAPQAMIVAIQPTPQKLPFFPTPSSINLSTSNL